MQIDEPVTTQPEAPTPGTGRIAFERLRERTDELELLVSGLTLFALLSAPRHIHRAVAALEPHLEREPLQLADTIGIYASGLCWTLGLAFLAHLCVRAYWIGLIGLKASFPDGIRWERITTMGPLTRDYYRKRIVDLGTTIDRADRAASVIFATAALVTLLMVSISGVVAALALLGFGLNTIGLAVDGSELASIAAFSIAGLALLAWAIDVATARLGEGRVDPRSARPVVEAAHRALGWFVPMRLVAPVQYTLQSNLGTRAFTVGFMALTLLTPALGFFGYGDYREFALMGGYRFVDDQAFDAGQRSAHYESMRGERDRLLRLPMIPSDMIDTPYLRVFLPHRPARDNPLLAKTCRNGVDAACHARLWSARMDGKPVALDAVVLSERRDLELRGLQGYVPLAGFAPGPHVLEVTWNPRGPIRAAGEDGVKRTTYRIPFWFAPAYQLELTRTSPAGG